MDKKLLSPEPTGLEPPGCPTPGACSCPAAPAPLAPDAEAVRLLQVMEEGYRERCNYCEGDLATCDRLTAPSGCRAQAARACLSGRGEAPAAPAPAAAGLPEPPRYHQMGSAMCPAHDTFTGKPAGEWMMAADYDALRAEAERLRAGLERSNAVATEAWNHSDRLREICEERFQSMTEQYKRADAAERALAEAREKTLEEVMSLTESVQYPELPKELASSPVAACTAYRHELRTAIRALASREGKEKP